MSAISGAAYLLGVRGILRVTEATVRRVNGSHRFRFLLTLAPVIIGYRNLAVGNEADLDPLLDVDELALLELVLLELALLELALLELLELLELFAPATPLALQLPSPSSPDPPEPPGPSLAPELPPLRLLLPRLLLPLPGPLPIPLPSPLPPAPSPTRSSLPTSSVSVCPPCPSTKPSSVAASPPAKDAEDGSPRVKPEPSPRSDSSFMVTGITRLAPILSLEDDSAPDPSDERFIGDGEDILPARRAKCGRRRASVNTADRHLHSHARLRPHTHTLQHIVLHLPRT